MTSPFDTALGKLLNNLVLVSERVDTNQATEGESKTTRRLKRFQSEVLSGQTPATIVRSPFLRLLENHLTSINRGPSIDAWLKQDKVQLVLPLSKHASNPTLKAEVYLGKLYRAALEIRDQAQNDLDSSVEDPELNQRYAECKELILPAVIKLNLYRIFAEIGPATMKSHYQTYVAQLERELGIGSGQDDVRLMLSLVKDETSMLGTLFKAVKPVVENFGIDPDKLLEVVGEMTAEPQFDMANLDVTDLMEKMAVTASRVTAEGKTLGGDTGFTMDKVYEIVARVGANKNAPSIISNLRAAVAEGNGTMDALTKVVEQLQEPDTVALFKELAAQELDETQMAQFKGALAKGVGGLVKMMGGSLEGTADVANKEETACEGDVCVRPAAAASVPPGKYHLDTFDEEE